MAVAHDIASESHTGATGSANEASFSWSHGGAASGVRGVLVFVFTFANSSLVSSVTYGGVDVPAVAGGEAIDTANEPGRCRAFFLGANVPQGTQTVVVNRTNNGTLMYAVAVTVLADTDTEPAGIVLLQDNGTLAEQSADDGSLGTNSVRYAGVYSGLASPPAAGANSTLIHDFDPNASGCAAVRETTAGQGARSVGFSSGTSDDRAAVHLAVRQIPPVATLAVLDDFNRAGPGLGGNWGTISGLGASALTIDSNQLIAGSGYQGSYWSAGTFGPDSGCYVSAPAAAPTLFFGLFARMSSPTGAVDGYQASFNPENGGEVRLLRYDDGVETNLATVAFTTMSSGDGLAIECIGSTIRVYTREGGVWTKRIEVTDATYSAAGFLGLHTFDAGGVDWRFDDFGGGTISAGGGPQTIPVVQAVETDVAQPVGRRKTILLGQAVESDASQVVAELKARAVAQAGEAGVSQPLGRLKVRTVGQPAQADTGLPVAARKARGVGQAQEVEVAQPVTVVTGGTVAVNQAVESDVAQAVGRAKARTVGQAAETDTAQPLGRLKTRALGLASETSVAQALGRLKTRALGLALESSVAGILTRLKRRLLGQPVESDVALPMTVAGVDVPATIVLSDRAHAELELSDRAHADVVLQDRAHAEVALSDRSP